MILHRHSCICLDEKQPVVENPPSCISRLQAGKRFVIPICVALLESCEAQAMKTLENLVTALRRLMHRMILGRLR